MGKYMGSAIYHWESVIKFLFHFFQASGNNVHYTYDIFIQGYMETLKIPVQCNTSIQVEHYNIEKEKEPCTKYLRSGWWSSTTSWVNNNKKKNKLWKCGLGLQHKKRFYFLQYKKWLNLASCFRMVHSSWLYLKESERPKIRSVT